MLAVRLSICIATALIVAATLGTASAGDDGRRDTPWSPSMRSEISSAIEDYYSEAWRALTDPDRSPPGRAGPEIVYELPSLRRGVGDALVAAGHDVVGVTLDGDLEFDGWNIRVYILHSPGFSAKWGVTTSPFSGLASNDQPYEAEATERWVAFAWRDLPAGRSAWAITSLGAELYASNAARVPVPSDVVEMRRRDHSGGVSPKHWAVKPLDGWDQMD